MKYSKNTITNLLILSLSLATLLIILIYTHNPLIYKFLYFSKNHSSLQKDELQLALEKASTGNNTVIIAIINKAYVEPHEDEYPTMFDLFLEGFWAGEQTRSLVENLLLVAMDETAYQRCLFRRLNCYKLDGGDMFSGEKVYMSGGFIEMMWRRTFFLINVLKKGYNFIFTDTDVLWLRNPFTRLSMSESIDLQISTDVFLDNPQKQNNFINTGFYFIRSNNKTISLFETWYDERKNSTGLKEQDVLVKLLRQGIFGQLDMNTRFLDTLYFSGFCGDSKDVTKVATVHANCCRTIKAKVADLKTVLRDWKRFRGMEKNESNSIDKRPYGRNFTNDFLWSKHVACNSSWLQT